MSYQRKLTQGNPRKKKRSHQIDPKVSIVNVKVEASASIKTCKEFFYNWLIPFGL